MKKLMEDWRKFLKEELGEGGADSHAVEQMQKEIINLLQSDLAVGFGIDDIIEVLPNDLKVDTLQGILDDMVADGKLKVSPIGLYSLAIQHESPQTEKIYDLFNYSSATQGIAIAEALGETELAEKFKVLHQAVLRFVEAGLALEQVGRGKDGDEKDALKAALKDIVSPTGSYFKTFKEVATWGGVEKYIPMNGNQWWRNMNSATLHLIHWHAEEDKAAAWESIKDWAGKSEL